MDSVWRSGKLHYAFSASTLLYILKKSQLLRIILSQYFPIVQLSSRFCQHQLWNRWKPMVWEPRQANSEETAPSLFRPPPWQFQVVSRLGSRQISPPRSELSGEAWHKVRSNQLKAALLDSQPMFPVIPQMELLACRTEKTDLLLSFVNIRSTKLE